jgi:hypothetical protein
MFGWVGDNEVGYELLPWDSDDSPKTNAFDRSIGYPSQDAAVADAEEGGGFLN